jgi:hypothetical protein
MRRTLMTALAALGGIGVGVSFHPTSATAQQGAGSGSETMPVDPSKASRLIRGGSEVKTATATVQSVDKEKRTVTLKDEDGTTTPVKVPEDVPSFDRIKKGDKVRVTYAESVAVEVHRPGEATPGSEVRETSGRTGGANPSRTMEKVQSMSAEVLAVDPEKNTLKVKGAQGKTREITVQDPTMRERLKELKKGDVVELRYTEAVAVSLEPKK